MIYTMLKDSGRSKPSITIISTNVRFGLNFLRVGDATVTEWGNSDQDETVAFGEDVPEASGKRGLSGEEVPAVNSEEDELEWNLETLIGSMEPDESQRGRVRRRPTY